MEIYSETAFSNGRMIKSWNYCHSSGYAGLVEECFYASGKLRWIQFSTNEMLHRDPTEGPAVEEYEENGDVFQRQFIVDGKYHRPVADGPAHEKFRSGTVHKQYWVDGVKQSEKYESY